VHETASVSLSDAVDLLGWRAECKHPELRLTRTLRAREKKFGIRVLVPVSNGSGRGTRYRINLKTLRLVMHELHSPRDAAAAQLGRSLNEVTQSVRMTHEQLDELKSDIATLATSLRELVKVVKTLK
jgi:hypothetical protein